MFCIDFAHLLYKTCRGISNQAV